MSDEYEHELTGSRAEIAAALTGVADGVLAGRIRLGQGDEAVAVDAPEELSLEIELETVDDEVELELELEWSAPEDGGPVVAPIEEHEAAADHREGDDGDDITAEDAPSVPVGAADASASLARFEVFQDRSDEWRWRLRHRNGNVIATSGEGYTRKHNATKGLRSVMRNSPAAEVTESE